MLSIWAGIIVKDNAGLFLEVFWFYGIADFGFGIFPGDGEGEAWKEVVDNYRGVSAGRQLGMLIRGTYPWE